MDAIPDAIVLNCHSCPEQPPLGTGEGSQGPTVAAIANALFNATGARIRDRPFSQQRVKAAIA